MGTSHEGGDGSSADAGFWGVGPLVGLTAAASAGAFLLIARATGWPWAYAPAWHPGWSVAGGALVVLGVAAYAGCLTYFRRRFRAGLVTSGPFARIRHPLYAIWILSILPGCLLPLGSGLALLAVLDSYLAARLLVRYEEDKLTRRYGDEYRAYRERTGALLPWRWG